MNKKTLRILAIRNSIYIGGAELYYLKLADAFKKYRVNCKLILLTNNPQLVKMAKSQNIESYNVNVFSEEIGTKRGFVRLIIRLPGYLFKYLIRISKIVKTAAPDVIVFSGRTEKIVLTPLLKLFGMHVVWLEHGREFDTSIAREILFMYKCVSYFSNKIFVEARDIEFDLVSNNIEKSKIVYIGSGIDTDYFSPKTVSKENIIVGYMASLTKEKGIMDFLDIALVISNRNKKIKFIILGEGPELITAKKFAEENNLSEIVTFVGWRKDPRKYLSKMSIFLSPIKHPGGISLSVQSAMSMGIVPIVTDIGGNKELVISGLTGYIFRNFEAIKVSKIILELSRKPQKLKTLSEAARSHIVLNYSSSMFAKKWYSILKNVLLLNF